MLTFQKKRNNEEPGILVESGTARLWTTIYPRSGAETVILLHGGPGLPGNFSSLLSRLRPRYQVIHFDQRGTGRSPVKEADYTLAAYIDDLNALGEHFEVSSFHLFGHSWGGLYAQLYAEEHPDW